MLLNAKKSPYRVIQESVRKDIESKTHRPGTRLPSDSELAGRFGVSRLTVIKALRELEAEGLVQRKAGSGTYVLGPAQSGTRTFGLLMPDIGEGEVFEPISHAITRAGESHHHRVLWGHIPVVPHDKERYANELCQYFISCQVAGVFFAPIELSQRQDEINNSIAAELDRAGIPIVLIDRCIARYPERSGYDLVAIDNRRVGYRMTRHLLAAGCERIAFAFRPGSAPTVQARHAGYREALGEEGPYLPFQTDGADDDSLRAFLASARPDGFVCANDLTAAKMMHALLRLDVKIPDGIRMIGVNDVKYADFLPIPLTTFRQPCDQLGAAAMSLMLERLAHPRMACRDVLLDCELVVRQSALAKRVG